MKIFFKFILIISLIFTVTTIGQNNNREMLEDRRFSELLKKAKSNIAKTREAQKRATKKATTMVSQTKNKIVSLNTNVKELKTDLNETTKKLDYVIDTNVGIKFILFPISDTQKVRK
jgi:uncharacterized UPF0160 family protein